MTYRVEVAPAAVPQLRRLDPSARRRVQAAIELLAEQPRPSGAKLLVGGEGEWRVRAGDHHVVYEIHDEMLLVLVVAIGHRRDIYRSFCDGRAIAQRPQPQNRAPQDQPAPVADARYGRVFRA